jgi:two-component system, cell cycle sensor histidine kinase and response regulator CckA
MLGGSGAPTLRGRAEIVLRARHADADADNSLNAERVVEELRVHQVELELQNEQLRAIERDLVRQNDELRAAERELELSHARYRDLFDLAPAGYISLDAAGIIGRANRAAGLLLGIEPARLLQRSLAELTDGADLRALRAHLRAAARQHDVCEVSMHHSDGRVVQVLLESRPARDGGCFTVLNDISERRRAEQALSRANQELEMRVRARTRELASRNAALEEALAARAASEAESSELTARLRDAERLESLGLLAGGIAHDFNNILVGVMANADLLLETLSDLDPVVQEGLVTIKDAAHDAADLTRKLLVYAGRGQVSLELVQLDDLVHECVRLMQATAPPRVQLRAELGSRDHWINADAGQLRQVIVNLVTNAVEAVGDGAGSVVVRTRVEAFEAQTLARFSLRTRAAPGRFVMLEVEDTGVGMAAEQLSRIFEPFYTSKFTGRGLGLASVRGIVSGHDAALSVQSAPGRGSTFQIIWSLADAPAAPKAAVRSRPAPWRASGQALLVDDDPGVRRALSRQLELLGFGVTEVDSGDSALDIFRSAPARFRIAVVDRTMPGLSGDRLIELLHDIEPALPVVLVSGYSAMGPVAASERVAFLAKPMTVDNLRQVVSKLLDAPETGLHR